MSKNKPLPGLLNECLVTQSRLAARHITRIYNQQLIAENLKAQQISLLSFLYHRPQATAAELAASLGIERSALSRNLAVLETRGLVTSDQSGRGLRRQYHLTGDGKATLLSLSDTWHQTQNSIRAQVGEDGWETIHQAFQLLSNLMENSK